MNQRPSLLLVEDEPDQASIVSRWLAAQYDVTLARDGHAGCALAGQGRFAAVVSDVQLPGASGLQVLEAAKRAAPDRPTLLVTAENDIELAIGALRGGADDFLLKPLDRALVTSKVGELIARRRTQRRTVLAIGAHPDDVEIGVGGTLARHRQSGDRIVILTLTGGEAGGVPSHRAEEAAHAAEALGATLVLGELEDTAVPEGSPAIAMISDAIARFAPDVVYTHTDHDTHQDHRATHRATMVAARRVPNLFCYQSPSTTPRFEPSRFVEIDDHLEAKRALIDLYASQTAKCPYLAEDLIRATARYWGRFAGYRYVEPLEVVRAG